MKLLIRTVSCAYVLGLLASGAGCGAGKTYRVGREAEKRGDAHVAYDDYRRAGRKHAGSRAIAAGLRRTGPTAAAFWEAQATGAMNEGRYEDAWRMWMRTLEIRPNHPTAPQMIRQLQEQHADEVAEAREDWLRRGPVSLALAKPRDLVVRAGAGTTDVGAGIRETYVPEAEPVAVRMASSSLDAPASKSAPESAPGGEGPIEDGESTPTKAEMTQVAVAAPTSLDADAGSVEPAKPEPPEAATDHIVAAVPESPDTDNTEIGQTEISKPAPVEAEADRVVAKGADSSVVEDTATSGMQAPDEAPHDPESAVESRPKANPRAGTKPTRRQGEFLVIRTLSKKDRRYPKRTELIDRVTVKVKDTDDDLDADLDLYDGKRRIKKIRGLPIGRSQTFRTRSGKRYRLTILSIHHKSHTVRIGVKPA